MGADILLVTMNIEPTLFEVNMMNRSENTA